MITNKLIILMGQAPLPLAPSLKPEACILFGGFWGSEAVYLVRYAVFECQKPGKLVKYVFLKGSEAGTFVK